MLYILVEEAVLCFICIYTKAFALYHFVY